MSFFTKFFAGGALAAGVVSSVSRCSPHPCALTSARTDILLPYRHQFASREAFERPARPLAATRRLCTSPTYTGRLPCSHSRTNRRRRGRQVEGEQTPGTGECIPADTPALTVERDRCWRIEGSQRDRLERGRGVDLQDGAGQAHPSTSTSRDCRAGSSGLNR